MVQAALSQVFLIFYLNMLEELNCPFFPTLQQPREVWAGAIYTPLSWLLVKVVKWYLSISYSYVVVTGFFSALSWMAAKGDSDIQTYVQLVVESFK